MIGAFVLLLAGCGGSPVTFYPLNNPAYNESQRKLANEMAARPKVSAEDVVIFVTGRPEAAYREIGILSYTTTSPSPNEADIYQMFREKAAEVGADGVIILNPRLETDSYRLYPPALRTWATELPRNTFRGLAIRFIE